VRDLTPDGVVVTGRRAGGLVASYDLRATSSRLSPDGAVEDDDVAWPTLEREQLVFGDHPLPWHTWVTAWAGDDGGHLEREVDEFPCVLPEPVNGADHGRTVTSLSRAGSTAPEQPA
jgi:hypothetical protein